MYVYRKEEGLYTVGYFDPNDNWCPQRSYKVERNAIDQVAHLNGRYPEATKINERSLKFGFPPEDWDYIGAAAKQIESIDLNIGPDLSLASVSDIPASGEPVI